MAVDKPLTLVQLHRLFSREEEPVSRQEVSNVLVDLQEEYASRGVSIVEVANGFRVQIDQSVSPWISRLFDEKPPRYTRALLETLALIAYRQPVTRSEIEDVRGVSVSTNIIKTLMEREWVRVVGHKEVPGRPAMYATTKEFLDYFNLRRIDELPPLSELTDLDSIATQLEMPISGGGDGAGDGSSAPTGAVDGDDVETNLISAEISDDPEQLAGNVTIH
ncbi:SMC-Scp complex subunit ScpB [Chromatiales bacterium (ex Bugula neritina AB1)]|nr:SMC-Scp complex subunit ScpB [Chromatiales bacterium (ex Bugula neritina AB1)]